MSLRHSTTSQGRYFWHMFIGWVSKVLIRKLFSLKMKSINQAALCGSLCCIRDFTYNHCKSLFLIGFIKHCLRHLTVSSQHHSADTISQYWSQLHVSLHRGRYIESGVKVFMTPYLTLLNSECFTCVLFGFKLSNLRKEKHWINFFRYFTLNVLVLIS